MKEDRRAGDVSSCLEVRDLRGNRNMERDSPSFWNLGVGEVPTARRA